MIKEEVMEEGEIFSPDTFLEQMGFRTQPETPPPPPSLVKQDTEIVHYCPAHHLTRLEKNTERNGWEYLTCPKPSSSLNLLEIQKGSL